MTGCLPLTSHAFIGHGFGITVTSRNSTNSSLSRSGRKSRQTPSSSSFDVAKTPFPLPSYLPHMFPLPPPSLFSVIRTANPLSTPSSVLTATKSPTHLTIPPPFFSKLLLPRLTLRSRPPHVYPLPSSRLPPPSPTVSAILPPLSRASAILTLLPATRAHP